MCIDCNVNVSVERKRCGDCVKIHNREIDFLKTNGRY